MQPIQMKLCKKQKMFREHTLRFLILHKISSISKKYDRCSLSVSDSIDSERRGYLNA